MNATVNTTDLRIDGDVTLSGSGTLLMSDSTLNRIFGVASSGRLINEAGHTIEGAGLLGNNFMLLTNRGTIRADGTIAEIKVSENDEVETNQVLIVLE